MVCVSSTFSLKFHWLAYCIISPVMVVLLPLVAWRTIWTLKSQNGEPVKNSGLYGIWTLDLWDAGEVLYQLSWRANWDLVIWKAGYFLLRFRFSFATESTTAMIVFTFKEDFVRQITLEISCSIKKVLESEVGFGKNYWVTRKFPKIRISEDT